MRQLMLALLLSTLTSSAAAHLLNMTKLRLTVPEQGSATLTIEIDLGQSLLTPESYWTLAKGMDPQVSSQRLQPVLTLLERDVQLRSGGRLLPLEFVDASFKADSLAAIRNPLTPQMATLRWHVAKPTTEAIEVRLASALAIPWPCLVRVDSAQRSLPASNLLSADRRSSGPMPLSDRAEQSFNADLAGSDLVAYGALGFRHVLPDGWDHALFVLGLFLLGGSLRQLALLVTGFTLAHSLTLGLAMVGLVTVPASVVEPLIAGSIVYLGIERLFRANAGGSSSTSSGRRGWIVFAFGLLHGLGFAKVLGEIGLPPDQYLGALFAFNIGIEIAQLTILIIVLGTIGLFRKRQWYESCIEIPGATGIAGVGLYWLLQRLPI